MTIMFLMYSQGESQYLLCVIFAGDTIIKAVITEKLQNGSLLCFIAYPQVQIQSILLDYFCNMAPLTCL